MEPMRFKKIIYKVRKYVQDEKIFKGSAPATPLLDSQYTASFIAGLTIGSHTGAGAAALYHSLAITCHRCGVNVYDYFCDIIDQCAAWPPNTPLEKYRELLPDRWKP